MQSMHTMIPSSLWLICLAAVTKLQIIGRHFSEVQL